MYNSSSGKDVYDGKDGYVYSRLYNLEELYATQYMTWKPTNVELLNYMNHLEKSYILAERYFDLKIVELNHENKIYITKCPKYDGDLNNLFSTSVINVDKYQIMDKIIDLIVYLKQNSLVHDDIAFRNICYKVLPKTDVLANSSLCEESSTNEITLHMIDFEQLREYDKELNDDYSNRKNIKLYLTCLINDISDIGDDIKSYFLKNLYERMC